MLLEGKRALIFGVANQRSIAYGIAKAFKEHGAELGFSYASDAIKKRLEPISDELGGSFILPCNVQNDEEIAACKDEVEKRWGNVDILIHSIAFADRDDLKGRFVDTSRAGFHLALDVSAYSLVALAKAFEPLMNPESAILTLTYHGSVKVIPNYNVMGVAKAALEASMRYLAADLGPEKIRVNAISAGPIKTLAASGVGELSKILTVVEDHAPLHRNVTPDEVGGAALYLCSSLGAGTTGEVLYVDSGFNTLGFYGA